MNISRSSIFFAGASLAAMIATGPAFAQETAPQEAGTQSGGIQDIIVTAQRRAENLQKSSVAIEVLSAEAIAKAGVTQARDLGTAVAGLEIGQGGAATQIYIRGVGDFGSTSATNPAVAFNVDGVYVARPAGVEGNFFDVERVEVLKGPQGTLYGRNATGGAINIITNKPKLGVRSMSGAMEFGNYDKILAEAAVNIPIGDTLAIRLAGQVVNRDPYVSYNYDDDVHESARAQLLWQPDDKLSVRVGGDYIHVGGGGAAYVPLQKIPGVSRWSSVTDPRVTAFYEQQAVATGLCAPRGAPFPTSPGNLIPYSGACPNLVIPGGPIAGTYTQAQLVQPPTGERGDTNNEFYSVFGQLDYNFGPVTLTVLPAYRSASLDYATYPGLLRFDISQDGKPETSKATSLEVRLSHESDSLKAVLGGYYFDEKQRGLAHVTAGFVQDAIINQAIDTRNYAAFGQATLSLSDRFRLIGGIRYTSDRRETASQTYNLAGSAAFFQQVLGAGCVPGLIPGTASSVGCQSNSLAGKKTFTKLNWKAGAEFDVGPQNMLYATASTGFKAGGFYGGIAPSGVGVGTYLPETLLAFEGGSRNRFFNNKVQLNLEGFYYDYKNHQEAIIIQDGGNPPQTTQAIVNAGSGRVYGANVDLIFQPTRNDTLHIGVEYLNTKYKTFTYSSPILPSGQRFIFPVGGTGCTLSEATGPARQVVDCSGFPLTRSPKWSGLASYSHSFDLGNGGSLVPEGSLKFASKRYLATDYLPDSLVGSYITFDANLTYNAPGDRLSVTAFIRNITNEAVYTASYKANFVVGFSSTSIQPPRTYGARVNFNF